MQFPEYMQLNFPGLHLGPALFYRWPVGIRFELNQDYWPNVKWDAVLQRACALYEAAFDPRDRGFIVSGHEFEFERKKRRSGKHPKLRDSVFTLAEAQPWCRRYCRSPKGHNVPGQGDFYHHYLQVGRDGGSSYRL